jgi:hypothetical protein
MKDVDLQPKDQEAVANLYLLTGSKFVSYLLSCCCI